MILNKFINVFFDENHHIDDTNAQDQKKIGHTKHFTVKRDTFPKLDFLQKSNCTDTFEQSPTMHNYFGARQIYNLTI